MSVPDIFKIPLKTYEKDMETKWSKGKKKEIIDLFTNHNNLTSEGEFKEIEFHLHFACQEGYLSLIKILLFETIMIDSTKLKFKIDKTNKTASLFKVEHPFDTLIVPRTVTYKLNDYLVTSITEIGDSRSFHLNIKPVKFEENSAVRTIYGHKFVSLNIEEIYFPDSLIELKKGWCDGSNELTKIIISPSNGQFIFKDDSFLLGKSDPNMN